MNVKYRPTKKTQSMDLWMPYWSRGETDWMEGLAQTHFGGLLRNWTSRGGLQPSPPPPPKLLCWGEVKGIFRRKPTFS